MKYNWCGSIADTVTFETILFASKTGEQPAGLVINKKDNFYDVYADQRFTVVLKINGQWIAVMTA